MPTLTGLEKWKRASDEIKNEGFNALELVASPLVTSKDLVKAQYDLEINFGTEYDKNKMVQLFAVMQSDNWTRLRFQRTFQWFLRNKRYPAWTIADWYEFGIKVYPEAWAYHKIGLEPHYNRKSFDWYKLSTGEIVCKFQDGIELPLEKYEFPALSETMIMIRCRDCGAEVQLSVKQDFWEVHGKDCKV